MKRLSTTNITNVISRLSKAIRLLDPRTVHLRDPGTHVRRTTAIVVAAAGVLVGAAALAASGRDDTEGTSTVNTPAISTAPAQYSHREAAVTPTPPTTLSEQENTPVLTPGLPPNFYDPLYVFTDEPAASATAYPMANPPAIVVDLTGVPEPALEPTAMVGRDSRVLSVRRRTTASGIRYIVKLTIPVKRISVEHEGNVVLIAPIR